MFGFLFTGYPPLFHKNKKNTLKFFIMVDLPNKEIKIFWEKKIRALLVNKGLMADETVVNELAGWVLELSALKHTWQEIEDFAVGICLNIYGRTSDIDINNNPVPTSFAELMAGLPLNHDNLLTVQGEYEQIRHQTFLNYEADLIEVKEDLIRTRKEADFAQKLLERLLKDVLKYKPTIDDRNDNDARLWFLHLKKNVLKNRSLGKILKELKKNGKKVRRNEKWVRKTLSLGVNDKLPNDWTTKLVKKSDLDTANSQITALTTDRDNQKNRADTLQTWKDSHNCSAPSCSHTDYDTIKQERDQLKTDKESHNCDCDSKVRAKETQIISKIITDLGLSTERERENILEAVIAEIKTKLTPPANNTDKNRISELEAEVISLRKPAPEVVAKMTEFSQELNIANTEYQKKLSQAQDYQQLVSIQSEAFKEKLTSEIANKNSAERLNMGLGALSIGSLLLLFWMIVKKTDFLPEKEKK